MIYLGKRISLASAVLASTVLASAFSLLHAQTNATISVDATKIKQEITPYLYGSCIEDVNHEIYGGLYDQRIFGESFEEPVPAPKFKDFSAYEGDWRARDNELVITSHPGAKLIYNQKEITDGSIATDLKFTGEGGNAGLLVCVSQPGNGADNFNDYEISLATNGKRVVIGKHKKNFEPVREIPVECNPTEWNNLKAVMKNQQIEIFLNDKLVFTFENKDMTLKKGYTALRVWNSNTEFRNLKIMANNVSQAFSFATTQEKSVSYQWDAYEKGDVKANYTLDELNAYNGKNSQTIELTSGQGVVGIANSGLNRWGIATRNGQKFQGRLYLKSNDYKGNVTVSLQSADGEKEYARQEIGKLTDQWKKYPFTITSNASDPKARFVIYIDQPGKIWIDQVTLMSTGKDQFKGLPFRNDISQTMVDQKLTFLRYGGTMVNAPEYRFKKMIGDPDKRPPYRGHWYRYSTNAFGIEDFLKFCEATGFTAAFAVNIEETPEDIADMVEYLNGPATSKWGKIRTQNGHPEPYNIKYIGIGNEEVLFNGDRDDEYNHYIERFHLLYDAIKSKDTSIKLINTAWWRPESPNVEKVFRALDGKADYWDYHPWANELTSGKTVEAELKEMKELFLKWNPKTTMKCALFEENGNSHNIERALGHVTVQNAVRRMGDFMLTSCAANALQPYLQNDNGWDQGQIFFTPSQVWGMPPFYAQKMASENHQPLLVSSTTTDKSGKLDVTATRSKDGKQLVLHVANTGDMPITTQLDIKGLSKIKKVKSITLSGKLEDRNTPEEPEKFIPIEMNMKNDAKQIYEIAPYSYTIFVYSN
ncbi:family 16 glycoside hydrolase [Bacteroides sp.]